MKQLMNSKVLVCDDDVAFGDRLAKAFQLAGCVTKVARNVEQGVGSLSDFQPDIAIIDLKMPGGGSGLDLLREIKLLYPSTKVLVLTGFGSIVTAMQAVRMGADNYLTKPARFEAICQAILNPSEPREKDLHLPKLEEVENEYMHRVLEETHGNISKSAKILGLHRRSLQRKLEKS